MKRLSTIVAQLWTPQTSVQEKDISVCILGAHGVGKTTFLYKLYFKYCTQQTDTPFEVLPTESHNVEVIPYCGRSYELWEFAEIAKSLEHIKDTQVLIYMVDATQQSNEAVASKARENMQWLLTTFSSAFQDTIILTIATKVNSEGAIDIRTLGQQWAEDTSLYAALSAHHWRLFACDASNEASLDAVLAYLHDKLERKKSLLGSPTTTATSTATATTSSTATSTPRPSVGAPSTISTTTSHNDLPPQATMPVTPWEHVPNPTHLSDTEFYAWFLARKQFLYFDHQCLLRTVFLTLQQEKRDLRPFLDHLCAILQAIVLLEQNPLKPSSPSSFSFSFSSLPKKTPMHPFIVYSETQALFWVQMTAYALLRCPLLEDKKTFDVFLRKCPELWNEEAWKMYYSPKVYLSSKAAQAFLPPDCKPLPNAFKPSALALKGNGLRIEYQVL